MTWLGRILDRIFALAGAIFFAQFPQFFSQYLHELSGHVAELSYQLSIIQETAKISQKSIGALIQKFLQSSDSDIIRQGDMLQGIVERYNAFTQADMALSQASLFTKPFLFIRYADIKIVKETLDHFQLGFSFNLESFVYAFIGVVFGITVYQGILAVGIWIASPFRKMKSKEIT